MQLELALRELQQSQAQLTQSISELKSFDSELFVDLAPNEYLTS